MTNREIYTSCQCSQIESYRFELSGVVETIEERRGEERRGEEKVGGVKISKMKRSNEQRR